MTITATFALGCFWKPDFVFSKIPGVTKVTVGYMGGHTESPTYKEVCIDATGHAEVVQIEFDPEKIMYQELLQLFWDNHDPTTMNRQGPDVGTQYRSAIYYHSPEQKQQAEASKQNLEASKKYDQPVVTEITEASTFYPTEEYHQKYFEKQGLTTCPT